MRHILIWVVTCIAVFVYFLDPSYALDVTLAWDANAETNLAGYKVYYGTTAGGPYNGSGSSEGSSPIVVPLGSLTTPSSPEFTVHGLAEGTHYFVTTAYNTDGLESGYSNEACTTVDNESPPVDRFPVANYAEDSTTTTYNESEMENATLATIYSLNNSLMLSGNNVAPGLAVAVDVDNDTQDELAVTFPGYGLWIYDPNDAPVNRWKRINPTVPEAMIRQGNGIACDYGAAYGLHSWSQAGGWQQLNTVDPGLMVAVDADNDRQDELVVTFSGYGLWVYDPGKAPAYRWKQINPNAPEAMIRLRNGIACDYGAAYGLHSWSQAGGWQQLNTVDPGLMVAVDADNDRQDELVVTFSGYGLWVYDPGKAPAYRWKQINPIVPEAMIRFRNGIACDYGAAYGLWNWTQAGGWRHLNSVDPSLMAAVDLDNDQQEELVVNFKGYGLYSYDSIAGWVLLNGVAPPTP